jgi:septum formation protein
MNWDVHFDGPFLIVLMVKIQELDGCILEKPVDKLEARGMIKMLSGRRHLVHTAVAIYRLEERKISLKGSFTETASVKFASLSDADVESYVESGEGMDKAGTVRWFHVLFDDNSAHVLYATELTTRFTLI